MKIKNSIILILSVCLLAMSTLVGCAEKAPKITDDDIKALIDLDIKISKYYNVEAPESDLNDVKEHDGMSYYRITDEKYDTWAEWEEFIRSAYTDKLAENVLLRDNIVNIDGNTYCDGGGRGYDLSDRYTYEILSNEAGGAEVSFKNPSIWNEEDGEESFDEKIYVLVYTKLGWRIDGYKYPDDNSANETGNTSIVNDTSCQISSDGKYYELDGRTGNFVIVIGDHEHPQCDTSDADLMALGQEKFEDAKLIDSLIVGVGVEVNTDKAIPGDGEDVYYDALGGEYDSYEKVMELYKNTISPDALCHRGYYSVGCPEELLEDYYFYGDDYENPELPQSAFINIALERRLLVKDGVTYFTGEGLADTRVVATKLCGVIDHTDTSIEYLLCSMVFDEEGEELLEEQGIAFDRPQVRYEHSVMKLELIGGKWLITQVRDQMGQYPEFIESYGYNF